jgi:hypothetical protein
MMAIIGIILLSFSAWLCPQNLIASSVKDLNEFRNFTIIDIRNFRVALREQGTSELKSADSGVQFVMEDSLLPLAWVEPGRMGQSTYIRMTPQLPLVMSYLSESSLVEMSIPSIQSCSQQYRKYLFDVFHENTEQMMKGQSIKDIDSPEAFAVSYGGVCKGCEKYFNPIPQELRPRRDRAVKTSIFFFYCHELGHIAKNHRQPSSIRFLAATDEKQRNQAFLEYMRSSREQETEADQWAIDQMIKMGMSPIDLMVTPAFELMIAYGGIECAFEKISTHPLGVTRMNSILSQIESSHRMKYGRDVPQPMLEIIRGTKTFADKVTTLLKCK